MPSRRSVLAAGGLATSGLVATGLAGCATVTGPPGIDATIRGDAVEVPDAETAPIVARAEARSGDHGCPEGLVRSLARVHEVSRTDGPDELVLVTEYDVITGESGCSSGWGQAGIAVIHDWRAGALPDDGTVSAYQSNVVPTGEASRRDATIERRHGTGTGDWRVHLTPSTKSTGTYHFVSTFTGAGTPADGDLLVETRAETQVRKGWVGGNAELGTGATLTYGDTDE